MEILIMGLGNIGHAMVSSITNKGVIVDTVTTNGDTVKEIFNNQNESFKIRNNYTYDNLKMYEYDFVIVTLPYRQKIIRLNQVKDKISKHSTIVLTPANQGMFYYVPKKLQEKNSFILLERVPQISRIEQKNKKVNIYGTRKDLHYSTIGHVEIDKFISVYNYLSDMIYHPNSDDITLISSNATIHTPRLYHLFQDDSNYGKDILFYKDWNDQDSKLFILVEKEISKIAKHKAKLENKTSQVYDMFAHFKVDPVTPQKLTSKICNNESLNKIIFNVKDKEELIQNRYFEDDIMIGVYFFIELAKKYEIEVPNLQLIYDWGRTFSSGVKEADFLKI